VHDLRERERELLAVLRLPAEGERAQGAASSGASGMMAPVFVGHVTDGHLAWDTGESAKLRHYLRSLDGKAIEAIIRPKRHKRSLDQNAWIWGVAYPLLGECLGYDRHEHDLLHYALLGECFGTTYDQRFGRELPRVSSSKMTTKEFSDYMEWLVRWSATEHGCVIPLPGETD
jgi:hypothetical protein